jgi:hypothetical protein
MISPWPYTRKQLGTYGTNNIGSLSNVLESSVFYVFTTSVPAPMHFTL